MKYLIIAAMLFLSLAGHAQTKVQTTPDGNFRAVKDTAASYKATGKTYADDKGNTYPVYISAKGKLFILRTSKTGNQYKQYLKLEN